MAKMSGKQGEIDRGAREEPKEARRSKINVGSVGNESHGDVRGVQEGGSMAEAGGNPLHHAKKELHSQHPIHHHDLGPHHNMHHHERHEPLHGLRPHKGHK